MSIDLSKESDLDCIPVVVLKNCEPEGSHVLAELFNMCLKRSCFPDCCKFLSVVHVFNPLSVSGITLHSHGTSIFCP